VHTAWRSAANPELKFRIQKDFKKTQCGRLVGNTDKGLEKNEWPIAIETDISPGVGLQEITLIFTGN
jgi:hypothetical protein